jgi:hypothetical protein
LLEELVNVRTIQLWKLRDVEVVHDVRERGRDVNVPVGGTIAYDETLEVVALGLLVYADSLVVLVELPSEVRDVDTSITLTGDVQRIVEELGEATEEVLHSSEGVLGLSHIIVNSIFWVHSNRVADTCRTLDVEDISALVPWLRIGLDLVFTIINNERTVLLEESQ